MIHRLILRRCVACQKLLDRQQLWRVTRDYKDGVLLEEGMGRSAYLCRNKTCLEEALRRKRIPKALRCKVPESVFEALLKQLGSPINSGAEAR